VSVGNTVLSFAAVRFARHWSDLARTTAYDWVTERLHAPQMSVRRRHHDHGLAGNRAVESCDPLPTKWGRIA